MPSSLRLPSSPSTLRLPSSPSTLRLPSLSTGTLRYPPWGGCGLPGNVIPRGARRCGSIADSCAGCCIRCALGPLRVVW